MWIKSCILIMAGIWCLLGNTQLVYAAQQETGVEVRLTKIELRLDSLEQRITAMEHSIYQRFADMMFWLQIIFSTMVIGIGGLIIQWFIMWKKIVWCEAQLKLPEKDNLIDVQREEIGVLKNLVMDLQQRLTGLEGVVLKAR
ncbi:MAG: hypothetical protein AAB110_03505 [Candidatus Desantisbacteria bacterium]